MSHTDTKEVIKVRKPSRALLPAAALLALLVAAILGVSVAWAAAKAPKIDETFVASVTATSADLGALVNPRGADTTYHFEYITNSAYEANLEAEEEGFAGASRAPTEAQGDADLGASEVDQPVAAHLSGLIPSSAYHFRVVAINSVSAAKGGPVTGPDHTFTTQEPGSSAGPDTCPNTALRSGRPSAGLPDCRAYEMVSPLDKNGGFISGIEQDVNGGGVVQAAANGNAVTYVSGISFADSQGAPVGSQYVARRSPAEGWLTHDITTPMSNQSYILGGTGTPYKAFSSDLSSGLVFGGQSRGQGIPVESPPLTPDAPAGYEDFYLYGIPGGGLRSLLTEPPGVSAGVFRLEFLAATADLSHVVLRSQTALAPDAVEGNHVSNGLNLYDWEATTGRFQTVNIPPGGAKSDPEPIMRLGDGAATDRAISEDGSRVVWTNGKELYLREGIGAEHPTTVQIDAPAGGGDFLTASSDDAKIFFSDTDKLTGEASSAGSDLYLFEPEGNRLVDLTVDNSDPGGAEVLGVLGASADGSSLYFVANGRLAPGATQGNCPAGRTIRQGAKCNLYLWHEGWETPRFIATLADGDGSGQEGAIYPELGLAFDWDPRVANRTARVSLDGTRVVFMSEEALTGYDNTVATGSSCGTTEVSHLRLPARCQEVFSYEASADEAAPGELSCLSCNPSGARPSGPSGIPAGTDYYLSTALYRSRVLSEGEGVGGRVFFDSADALLPQDANGVEDVYEWEPKGAGSCRREGGCIGLISAGTSPEPSSFVDASANGDDVFFTAESRLVGQDTDSLVDLYDARVSGGFSLPSPGPAPCEGDACHPPAQAPDDPTPGTATLTGPGGNQQPTSPKRRHKRRRHKAERHSHRRHRRAGRHNRAGAK